MKLSIVTTLYHSAPYIEEFHKRISAEAQKITSDYEIIFVNDGSPDRSLEVALKLYNIDKHVRVVDLSRNFGHHKAIMTGLAHAGGDYIFLIDVDLEEQPEYLSLFWQKMSIQTDHDVVYGVQKKRKGGVFERWSGQLFFKVFNSMACTKIPANQVLARLMSKRYVNALLEYSEREWVFMGICELAGFNKKACTVVKGHKGKTTYYFRQRMAMAINMVTSFSNRPLIWISYFGLLITVLSFIFAIKLIFYKLFYGTPLAGWTSTIISIWLTCGILTFCLGIIALYLSKIFMEVKQRPQVVVKESYTHE